MTYNQLYLAASIPQWGIFIGFVLVIIAYIDKKEKWMTAGWIILIATGLISLYFNLTATTGSLIDDRTSSLTATGWQCVTGAALAGAALLFQHKKNRYFTVLAVLTLLYFMLVFFQFNRIMRQDTKEKQSTEQINMKDKISEIRDKIY